MKKLFTIVLAVIMLLPLVACNGNSSNDGQTANATQAPTAVPTDEPTPTPLPHISWTKEYYVDEFNDPTDKSYIRGHFVGTFSNSATSGSALDVYFYIDHNLTETTGVLSEYDCFTIKLFEYGYMPVTYTTTTDTDHVTIKIKIDDTVYKCNPFLLADGEIYISRKSEVFKPFLQG